MHETFMPKIRNDKRSYQSQKILTKHAPFFFPPAQSILLLSTDESNCFSHFSNATNSTWNYYTCHERKIRDNCGVEGPEDPWLMLNCSVYPAHLNFMKFAKISALGISVGIVWLWTSVIWLSSKFFHAILSPTCFNMIYETSKQQGGIHGRDIQYLVFIYFYRRLLLFHWRLDLVLASRSEGRLYDLHYVLQQETHTGQGTAIVPSSYSLYNTSAYKS